MRFRRYLALALPLAFGLQAGCGDERDPVSYVQTNVLEKSFFVGEDFLGTSDDPEFWAQATLVNVGYGAGQNGLFTSTYAHAMSRVKWVIQEDELVARLAYERIDGSDGFGTAGKASHDGIVVAAFKIQSHFDIQRRYNPTTGEEQNVIEENTTDRPWYERRYMRVDWSKNLVTDTYDFDTLSMLGLYGNVDYTSFNYYVNDPSSEDAPYFDEKTGYFDITTKVFAKPGMIDLRSRGWGIDFLPACMIGADFSGGTSPAGNCNPIELTIRHSFRPVVDRDYEPQDWDGHRFQAFGAFSVERFGYDRNYGMTDDLQRRFVTRYNIWERSHYYDNPADMTGAVECYTPATTQPLNADPNRDDNDNGTADECEAVTALTGFGGSQCDHFKQKCTLPFRARKEVPQVWYYSTGSDPRYFDGTEWATHDWDIALRNSVMTARYAECARIGDEAECADRYPVWKGQMDDALDATMLSREIDACRLGHAYAKEDCDVLAETIAQKRGYSDAVIATARQPEMVVLCHSPVEQGDPPACATPEERLPANLTAAMCDQARLDGDTVLLATCNKALNARRGDLRFHVVNAIREPQTPSPWGIMADSDDPLTGEKVAASINVWTYVNDSWSRQMIDLARYIGGELKTIDVTEGTYVQDWSKAAGAASRNGFLGVMSADEVDKRLAASTGLELDTFRSTREAWKLNTSQVKAQVANVAKTYRDIKAGADATSTMRPKYNVRRELARGTATEAALVTPMMQQFAGTTSITDSSMVMDYASPLRAANPTMQRELRQMNELALANRGRCILQEAPAPLAIADLSQVLQAKFGRFDATQSLADQYARLERMQAYVAQRAQYSVIVHEMGHSVGLRHNFVSSSDAWGFRPQYWQLRTNDGTLTRECVDPNTDTLGLQPDGNCVGPRYFDPITDNERENLLWMWMHSSTMDYAGESTQDFLGLGAYDFAAARMFYGETMSVFADPSYKRDQPRGRQMLDKIDNFGGIIGIKYAHPTTEEDLHYSHLQREYEQIKDCEVVNTEDFRPATWNTARDGDWHPVIDGMIVQVNGEYTRCRQQEVDYVPYRAMIAPKELYRGDISGKRYDAAGRVRVPYGFATDNWADLGNLSVYRHDNGADAYELFDFFITQQEVGHIFDNYRRNRATFSVRGASNRAMSRFNEKMRDGAKGLGLMANIYREFAAANGYDFKTLWPYLANTSFTENMLASTIAFDQFTRLMQRPQSGPHFLPGFGTMVVTPVEDGIWRSTSDNYSNNVPAEGREKLIIPNGATGMWGNVGWGGRPIENALSNTKGEYNSQYTINAGSYYDKAFAAVLMTESVDNFISDSRGDFTDARYRAVSMADLFPDGYRRFLANNLTDDDALKGPRIAANASNNPLTDGDKYPAYGMGWTSWTPATGPEACFAEELNLNCTTAPDSTIVIDPQVSWEQQKFLIAWTLAYLPENQQQTWLNQMYIWEYGIHSDPKFENRIEMHDPMGRVYVAKTFGKETIFGKRVQKGISARILEYANELLVKAYETTDGPDIDGDDVPDWYIPVVGSNGMPIVKFDDKVRELDDGGAFVTAKDCNKDTNEGCECENNRFCVALSQYMEVPFFLRQAMFDYELADPSMRGIH